MVSQSQLPLNGKEPGMESAQTNPVPRGVSLGGRDIYLRRAHLIKVVSGFASATALFFSAFYALRGKSSVLEPVYLVVSGSAILYALIIPIAAVSYLAAATCFVSLTFVIITFVSLQSGRIAGSHIFLLLIGPLFPLMFGARRPYLIFSIASRASWSFSLST